MKKTTFGQRRAHATNKARSEARFRALQEASENGVSIEDASAITGLKVEGIKTLIYKKTGSSRWPMKKDILPA